MKLPTYFIIFALIILSIFSLYGEKKVKPLPMEELTNPTSLNYVPIPYPKNRKEVITDLRYYIENLRDKSGVMTIDGKEPIGDVILRNLIGPEPIYTIGDIVKVKNRIAEMADDYTWLIHILDRNKNVVLRFSMRETGLFSELGVLTDDHIKQAPPRTKKKFKRLHKQLKKDDVQLILSEFLGDTVQKSEIKKMERMAYLSTMGDWLTPMWVISMKNGVLYYYSENKHMIYTVDQTISWKKNKKGYRPSRTETAPHSDFLPDTIDDQLIVLKKVEKKK